MKLLFICKHNRFRSKVAEAIFNKMTSSDFKKLEDSKNAETKSQKKRIIAESAGLVLDELRPYIASNVIKIMKEKGYFIEGLPKRITSDKINDYDMLVIVANNVEPEFFTSSGFKGEIIKWEIGDADEKEYDKIKKSLKRLKEM